MKKEDIRRHVKARKTLLDNAERQKAALSVFRKLENLAAFAMSDRILMYHSLPDELSTLEFIEKWHNRKRFFLPRVNGVDLEILPYDRTRMHLGAFRIEEPSGDDCQDPADMELVVVPAVAYDIHGNRVGRGKGYYDRLLPKMRALKIGVAYDFQIFDEIDIDSFDIPVDMVITETRVFKRKNR